MVSVYFLTMMFVEPRLADKAEKKVKMFVSTNFEPNGKILENLSRVTC